MHAYILAWHRLARICSSPLVLNRHICMHYNIIIITQPPSSSEVSQKELSRKNLAKSDVLCLPWLFPFTGSFHFRLQRKNPPQQLVTFVSSIAGISWAFFRFLAFTAFLAFSPNHSSACISFSKSLAFFAASFAASIASLAACFNASASMILSAARVHGF